jgi:hypothetical protein
VAEHAPFASLQIGWAKQDPLDCGRSSVAATPADIKKGLGVKNALISPKAYHAINSIHNKFEPEWMFLQAEQFARSVAIPSDRLYEVLEDEPLFSGWGSITRLAKIFEVVTGTMKTRLVKLKLIEVGP